MMRLVTPKPPNGQCLPLLILLFWGCVSIRSLSGVVFPKPCPGVVEFVAFKSERAHDPLALQDDTESMGPTPS
jgi:hypothetical protein